MIDMSTWEELVVDVVDDLHLDPRNVRLEIPSSTRPPESDIIQDLFRNEKALALVEGIAKVGLLTHEVPIVVWRDRQLVVVEGNRRVAALKAIQNPYLAPEYHARITKLTQRIPERESLRNIAVKKAPSQDEADQLVAALHTGNQRLAWSPSRQAAFFQAQIDAGKTAEQLILQYPTVDVKKFVVRGRILGLFRSANYRDPQLKDYVSQRKFPVSTLARLYDYDKFLELAQIEVNETSASVELRARRGQFSSLAEKIIGDIKNGKINTRLLNSTKSPQYVDYMDALRDLLNETADEDASDDADEVDSPPGRSRSGDSSAGRRGQPNSQSAGTPGDPRPSSQNKPAASDAGAQSAKSKSINRKYLNTDNLRVPEIFPPSIHAILRELSMIDIQRFPNATLDLLRTFLEKSIKAHAESIQQDIKKSSNQSGYVFLSNCLTWLEERLKSEGQTAYIQVVAKIRSGKINGYVSSMDHLNAVNHNHQIVAAPDDVRECWNTMEGLMRVILKP